MELAVWSLSRIHTDKISLFLSFPSPDLPPGCTLERLTREAAKVRDRQTPSRPFSQSHSELNVLRTQNGRSIIIGQFEYSGQQRKHCHPRPTVRLGKSPQSSL